MALSVVYFQFVHHLGRPHYVWDEYMYSVLGQTKMDVGTERHLPKTDDWRLTILLQAKNTVFLFESFTIIYFSFHLYVLRHAPADPATPIVCLR